MHHEPPCFFAIIGPCYSFLFLILLVHAPLRLLVMVRFSLFFFFLHRFLTKNYGFFFYIHTIFSYQNPLFLSFACFLSFLSLSLSHYLPLYLTIPPLFSLLPLFSLFFFHSFNCLYSTLCIFFYKFRMTILT